MRTILSFFALSGLIFYLFGCSGVDARREQRWAAFEPLRPAPDFRLLPNRPLVKFDRDNSAPQEGADSKPGDFYVEPPSVWKSEKFDAFKIDAGGSKFFPGRFEQYLIFNTPYKGQLTVYALNAKMEEIGRASAAVDCKAGDAQWVVFSFPVKFSPNEVKVLSLEPVW